MTTIQRYHEISNNHRESSFAANVIYCNCSNRAKKIKGLYNLIKSGHQVTTPHNFDMFTVCIDGRIVEMSELEKHA